MWETHRYPVCTHICTWDNKHICCQTMCAFSDNFCSIGQGCLSFWWGSSVGGWLLMAPGWGLFTRKARPWLEAWNFQPCAPFLQKRAAEDGLNEWSCICVSIKISVVRGVESSGAGERVEVLGEWRTWRARGDAVFLPLPYLSLLSGCSAIYHIFK